MPISRACSALALCLAGLLLGACGDGGIPAGYTDPCQTPMAEVLGCPAGSAPAMPATAGEACRKLLACGILAEERLVSSTKVCAETSRCDGDRGGICLKGSDARFTCHYPKLDLAWCALRLARPGGDPCRAGHDYSAAEAAAAVQCMVQTRCDALGLRLGEKLLPAKFRPELDLVRCDGGKKTVWTATTCDQGILAY